ncbi:VOC family protein [Vulgatibacter incomptus]|uniref:VOC domain-containing protein n=1 Tax=Vulgatibacter incomptus TaxID=1391653 RepID=A0A0K1PBP3_9BACT|nr:glyoxalase/bleomycin resistance/extradiol dioxygenase family protein [Vulgatibacter incomptus]AKU90945.1 hypothetical protein AKJ08_1332 [Vulgatibacter incomptus]
MTHYLGLRTASYAAPDLDAAKAWYIEVLGKAPYFDQPFYVGFNVAGFELGLVPDAKPGVDGGVAYWGVGDARKEYARLLGLGAQSLHEPQDVGEGIITAIVRDPFGNAFGVIENPHFPNTVG